MKVLHLFQEYLSISESWAFNLIDSIPNIETTVGAIYWNELPEYFSAGFQYVPNKNPMNLREYFKPNGGLNNFKNRLFSLRRKIYKQEFRQIRSWCEDNSVDLIHVHFGTTAAHFIILLKRLKIPFVISFYGYDYGKAISAKPQIVKKYKKLFSTAKLLLVEEESGAEKLIDLGCPSSKIEISRLGVDSMSIIYRKPTVTEPLKFVQIANFVEKKGQEDIILMLAKYKKVLKSKVSMTFIGDDDTDYGRRVKALASDMNLLAFVEFLPAIPYAQLHSVMSAYDIFIHPSKFASDGDSEGGAPTILLDAQAVGLPIISTFHCDIPHYIPRANHCMLTKEGDIDKMFNVVQDLILQRRQILKISKEGRKYVESVFDIRKNGKILREKYRSIVGF